MKTNDELVAMGIDILGFVLQNSQTLRERGSIDYVSLKKELELEAINRGAAHEDASFLVDVGIAYVLQNFARDDWPA